MIGGPGPAAREEQAELQVLRARVDATGQEINDTMTALAGRLAEADPAEAVRRKAAGAMATAAKAAGRAAGKPGRRAAAGQPGLAVTGVTGIIVTVALAVLWQHRRHG